jgi:hypothetical protein
MAPIEGLRAWLLLFIDCIATKKIIAPALNTRVGGPSTAISVYRIGNSLKTMKLDDWLTRLVAVPPGRSPLANGLAIGMRIAFFILVPLGIIAAIAIALLHR